VYDSASNEHEEAPITMMVPRILSCILREESRSLLRTNRRLSHCG
jgi:hypothetical protein